MSSTQPRSAGSRRTLLLTLCILLFCLSFVSCDMQSSSANTASSGDPEPATVMLTFCDDGVSDCPAATSFSLSTIRDLVVKVDWYNVAPGNHSQELEVLLPEGGTYDMSQTGFLVAADSQGMFSSARTVRMAGSWAAQRRETGNWKVEALLDGKLVTSQAVEMTQ